LGRPGTLADKRDDVLARKKKGLGVRAMTQGLRMPVSSVGKLLSISG
jgi:hypothetical protein